MKIVTFNLRCDNDYDAENLLPPAFAALVRAAY